MLIFHREREIPLVLGQLFLTAGKAALLAAPDEIL